MTVTTTDYLALYKEKAVKAIGDVICIIDVDFEKDFTPVNKKVIEGSEPVNLDNNLRNLVKETWEKEGKDITEERRFFIVDQFYETNFVKRSKGPVMGMRYLDLFEVDGFNEGMSAKAVAELLNGQEWDIK